MNSEGRIEGEQDLMHYYQNGELGYSDPEELYYDPKYNLYFLPNGVAYNVRKHYSSDWFARVVFRYSDHSRCPLPEQDQTKTKERKPPRRNRSQRVNFLIIGTMSTCSMTDFNEANNAIVDWQEQMECDFAVMSMEGCRCMFWNSNLDGHCSCHEAYDDASSGNSSLERIDSIREKDKEREEKEITKNPEHHFEESEEISVDTLSDLYNINQLITLKTGPSSDTSIFYYKEWDAFFDGHGKFLKEMTKQKRKTNKDPDHIAQNWIGPLYMTDEWSQHVAHQLFTDKPNAIDRIDGVSIITDGIEDNSGTLTPLEMHEALHEIAKIVHSKDPITSWEVAADLENIVFTDVYLDEKKE